MGEGEGEGICLFVFSQTVTPEMLFQSCCVTAFFTIHISPCTLPLCFCLSPFPVLCFKAEACVTHSTWHMKPLSCLEPGERERKTGGERERDVGGGWVE